MPALLAELRSRDIQIRADGNRLRCNAPAGVLTAELRDQVQQRKSEILEFLRSAEALARRQRAIVPLQAHGARAPVFAVPGHVGDVFCYRALAQHLGDDQPFFGLQPPGLDEHSEPLERIEDLAAYFAAQIRAFRPGGPYIIAGYCAGGTIAFELARQLLQEGAAISFLVLFGSPYPSSYRPLPQLRMRIESEMVWRIIKWARVLMSLPFGEWQSYFAERWRRREARIAGERAAASDLVMVERARVGDKTIGAARRYTPGPYTGRVCLFLPCEGWARSGNLPLRWRSVARATEVYFGPDGCDGDNMLREPYAPTFAELFNAAMRAA